MFRFTKSLLTSALIGALSITAGFAAPTLKANVTVHSKVVTVGDMFDDAGMLAEEGLFRAPAPGTVGAVTLPSIKLAAQRVGIDSFDAQGITHVRVERPGIAIDNQFLSQIFGQEAAARGQLLDHQEAQFAPFGSYEAIYADPAASSPATLLDFTFEPQTGRVAARLALAGHTNPIRVNGRLEILEPAAHLGRTMVKGEIIDISDIEFKSVPVRFSKTQGDLRLEDLVGKSLTRAVRGGSMIKISDLSDPVIIDRNELVTLFYQHGPLKLTVKGQALHAATEGQLVTVLNLMSKKPVQGIAAAAGTVLITNDPTRIASR